MRYPFDQGDTPGVFNANDTCKRCGQGPIKSFSRHNAVHSAMARLSGIMEFANPEEKQLLLSVISR